MTDWPAAAPRRRDAATGSGDRRRRARRRPGRRASDRLRVAAPLCRTEVRVPRTAARRRRTRSAVRHAHARRADDSDGHPADHSPGATRRSLSASRRCRARAAGLSSRPVSHHCALEGGDA
ncbi:hypothetical protein ACGFMM_33000 [Streptomyces sp. NPDC048604]|uniref:hypothetical protein n=1 Tax=Streptomyces sp. NPDC048604 TaxID=3365578 RepID=UPI003722931B